MLAINHFRISFNHRRALRIQPHRLHRSIKKPPRQRLIRRHQSTPHPRHPHLQPLRKRRLRLEFRPTLPNHIAQHCHHQSASISKRPVLQLQFSCRPLFFDPQKPAPQPLLISRENFHLSPLPVLHPNLHPLHPRLNARQFSHRHLNRFTTRLPLKNRLPTFH